MLARTLIFCFILYPLTSQAEIVLDPLDSPSWEQVYKHILSGEKVIFDENVIVSMPELAEDPMNVPVSVEARGFDNIQEILVFADLNPIQKVLSFEPVHIKPRISFRIKVERSTPVRAAVKTTDGVWHVGGRWLSAAGGGCTAPSYSRVNGNWFETLMDMSSRSWYQGEDIRRIRFKIMHPMDTGLAPGIPVFYIEKFKIEDSNGVLLANVRTYEPVGENPVFTFDLVEQSSLPLSIIGADNNGNRIDVRIEE